MTTSGDIFQILNKNGVSKIIIDAIVTTISNYSKCETSSSEPFVRTNHPVDIQVAGMMCIKNERFSADLLLGFPKDLFIHLYNSTTQSDLLDLTADEMELAGELLNVAFGVIDQKLTAMGISLKAGFPKILAEKDIPALLKKIPPESLVVPLETSGQKYYLMILHSPSSS